MLTPRILVSYNNDDTACFDRIMSHILCLFLQSYQIQAKFTALLGNLLRYVKYAIKTAYGVSKEIYSHSTGSPEFRSGQGNTVSATRWLKLVSITLDKQDKQRLGSHYSDTDGFFTTIIGIIGFVGDNNILNTGET